MSSAEETPTLLELSKLEQAAECLKTLAHPHRLRMIQMLLPTRSRSANSPRHAKFPATWLQNTFGSCNAANSSAANAKGVVSTIQSPNPT